MTNMQYWLFAAMTITGISPLVGLVAAKASGAPPRHVVPLTAGMGAIISMAMVGYMWAAMPMFGVDRDAPAFRAGLEEGE